MKYHRIVRSPIKDDTKRMRINGYTQRRYGMPSVLCDVCKGGYSGGNSWALECPDSCKKIKTIAKAGCVSIAEFKSLKEKVESEFAKIGVNVDIKPRDDFEPLALFHTGKKLLSIIYPGNLVFRLPVKQLFEEQGIRGAYFRKVTFADKPKEPIENPEEPEELVESQLNTYNSKEVFWELNCLQRSGMIVGAKEGKPCKVCGYRTYTPPEGYALRAADIPKGVDVFYLNPTGYVICNEKAADFFRPYAGDSFGLEPLEIRT